MRIYIYSKDLIKKIYTTPIELLIKIGSDASKQSLTNNILELTINDDRKFIEAIMIFDYDYEYEYKYKYEYEYKMIMTININMNMNTKIISS